MVDYTYNNVSNQTFSGTAGDDRFSFSGSGTNDIIYGNQGHDVIRSENYSFSKVFGGMGNDELGVFTDGSMIYGNFGNDTIYAEGQQTKGFGGKDNDTLITIGGSSIIYGNLGDDGLVVSGVSETAFGGQGTDKILFDNGKSFGTATNGVAYGNLGDDLIDATNTNGTMYGGQGNDVLAGSGATAVMRGGLGNDTFFGGTTYGSKSTVSAAITVADFVSGTDKIDMGGNAGTSANFKTASIASDSLSQAAQQASKTSGTYTLVKGATDSYLFLRQSNGDLTGMVLDNTSSLVASDITSGTQAFTTTAATIATEVG